MPPALPGDQLLLPPALSDWVPEKHLARFVDDIVDGLDLSAIEDTYDEERGYPPYHPRMMVKVLLYAYATGTYSSRRIEEELEDSVAFRFLAAGNQPDFRTVSDFRKRHGKALSDVVGQVLRLCKKAGLVKLGRVAVDGTKIQANSSKHKAISYGRMKSTEAALQREADETLAPSGANGRRRGSAPRERQARGRTSRRIGSPRGPAEEDPRGDGGARGRGQGEGAAGGKGFSQRSAGFGLGMEITSSTASATRPGTRTTTRPRASSR